MSNPNSILPQGSLDERAKGKPNIRLTVFTIVAIHVVLLCGILMQGCTPNKKNEAANTHTNAPDATLSPIDMTNLAPSVTNLAPIVSNPPPSNAYVAPLVTNVAPPVLNPAPVDTGSGTTREYVVVKGDSFKKIATAHGLSVSAVAKANPGVDSSKLRIGQKLQLPASAGSSSTAANPEAPAAATTETSGSVYVVKTGDTLHKIASANGTTVKAIEKANALKSTQIKVGQKLKLPAKSKPAASEPASPLSPGTVAAGTNLAPLNSGGTNVSRQ